MPKPASRTVFRWIHIALAIPILGYVYGPFEALPSYAPQVRFIFLPALVLTGLWMWLAPALRRVLSRRATNSSVVTVK